MDIDLEPWLYLDAEVCVLPPVFVRGTLFLLAADLCRQFSILGKPLPALLSNSDFYSLRPRRRVGRRGWPG